MHVMLMELATPLREGATFPLTLAFEAAGEVTVEHLVHGNLEDGGMRTVQTLAVDGARVYEVNHPAMGADQAEEVKARHIALLEDLRAGTQDG